MDKAEKSKYEYFTYERKHGAWVVYGWGTYPRSSVLAGQAMKQFINSFETEEEAREFCPEAERSNAYLEPQASVPHCPPSDWSHYDAGEYWGEDDY